MKKKFIAFSSFVLIFFMILLGYYYHTMRTRNSIGVLIQNKQLINILVAGSNVFNDNKHSFYGILTINPENNKKGFTFIPPNLRISLDERRKDFQRIDQIDINDFDKLSAYLNNYLKLNIPFNIEMYSPDVEQVVDLIEGIDLYIIDQANDIEGIKFGLNYFDGKKIVQYINSAEENSIYIKYDRIQDILLSLYYNNQKYKKFTNLTLISTALKSLKTNLLAQEIMTLIDLLLNKPNIIFSVLPGRNNDEGFYCLDDIAYKIYEKDFLTRIVFKDDVKPKPSLKLKILNGTGIYGLAKKMRDMLVREGLNVVEFGTSPYPLIDHTIIINQKGDIGAVSKVSELIGIDRIYHITDSMQLSNVLIIIGKDFVR